MSLNPNQSWQFTAILKEKDCESWCMDVASKSRRQVMMLRGGQTPASGQCRPMTSAGKNGGRKVGHACARLNSDGGSRKALVSGLCQ